VRGPHAGHLLRERFGDDVSLLPDGQGLVGSIRAALIDGPRASVLHTGDLVGWSTASPSTTTARSPATTCSRSRSRGRGLTPGQVDTVTGATGAAEDFEPRHTTHGFRYMGIEGACPPLSTGEAHDRGPRVDLHAHPGRFFLEGIDRPRPDVDRVQAEAAAAGMAAVCYATVADVPVLGMLPGGGIAALREFADGEAYADHLRQLAVVHDVAARHHTTVVRGAGDIEAAHAGGGTCLFPACEGADFAEDDLGAVAQAHEAGVRSVTLVHYRPNAFGDCQTAPAVHGGSAAAAGTWCGRPTKRVSCSTWRTPATPRPSTCWPGRTSRS
jgi:hypothetical protein